MDEHMNTVRKERERKEGVKRAKEEAARERMEEKRRKKEAKEAARKAAELKRLREEVNTVFLSKGEFKDSILNNEVSEITGFHNKASGAVGTLGGFLGQMALVIAGAHKRAKQLGLTLLSEAKTV